MVEEDSSQTGSNFVANNSSDNKDLYKDSMTYDKTKYAMHVFVTNNADGTCKVSSVYFRKLEDITNNTGTTDTTDTTGITYTVGEKLYKELDGKVNANKGDYVIGTNGDYRPYDADSDGDAQRFERVELNPIQQRLYALTNSITITGSSSPVWFADWDTGTDTVINGKFSNLSGDGKGTGLTTVGTSSTKLLIGEHDNSFDVINAFDDKNGITPTGLIVKNLPFIVMIALGVLAFLGLTKKRRAND